MYQVLHPLKRACKFTCHNMVSDFENCRCDSNYLLGFKCIQILYLRRFTLISHLKTLLAVYKKPVMLRIHGKVYNGKIQSVTTFVRAQDLWITSTIKVTTNNPRSAQPYKISFASLGMIMGNPRANFWPVLLKILH